MPHSVQSSRSPLLPSVAVMVSILLTLICVIAHSPLQAGSNVAVRPIRHTEYGAGTQNWMARQDSAGRMYFGNRSGLLIFDGSRWELHTLPNFSTVRSLLIDNDGRAYVGGSEEFGYFTLDPKTGRRVYTSLIPTLHEKVPFSEVWNIMRTPSHVWFQSDNHLFRYDGKSTVVFPFVSRLSCSALIDNTVYLAFQDGQITRFQGSRAEPLPGAEALRGNRIVSFLPYGPEKILIATTESGLFVYDNGVLTPMESDITPFLRENQIFSAARSGANYAFGTITGGAVIKNFITGETSYINRDNGLPNMTVLSCAFDRSDNLWLCLDDGIGYAVHNTPVTELLGRSSSLGAGYAAMIRGGKIYLGTNQGLYSATWEGTAPTGEFDRELRGQIWSLDTVTAPGGNSVLFASGDNGLQYLSATGWRRVEGIGGAHAIKSLPGMPGEALAATYQGFHRIGREATGEWIDRGRVEGYDDITGKFIIDANSNVWISHWMKGVYRLPYNEKTRTFRNVRLYNSQTGFPSDRMNAPVLLPGGDMLFTSSEGLYRLNRRGTAMIPDKTLAKSLPSVGGASLHVLTPHRLALAGADRFSIIDIGPGGEITVDSTDYRSIAETLIPGYIDITPVSDSRLLVAHQEGFWDLDLNYHDVSGWSPGVFVTRMVANRDSTVYTAGPDGGGKAPRLSYDLNSVRIDFSYPEYSEANGVTYSSLLEGYDHNWTAPTTESSREYTRLPEGKYTLHVRATHRRTGHTAETSFDFEVLPPWYRSVPALVVYALLLGGAIWLTWRLVRRWASRRDIATRMQKEEEMARMKRASEREALEKDFQITALKSEQLERDIRYKGEELSNMTMSLVQKNEILQEIANKIAKLRESCGPDTSPAVLQRQLTKIHSSINDSISQDDALTRLDRNFDQVYENFTKRLMERHPDITPSERRLCCYVKMGLSSKEIAPLVNISYRSVEMTRYRLRKKMGLTREQSLTTYLQNIT